MLNAESHNLRINAITNVSIIRATLKGSEITSAMMRHAGDHKA